MRPFQYTIFIRADVGIHLVAFAHPVFLRSDGGEQEEAVLAHLRCDVCVCLWPSLQAEAAAFCRSVLKDIVVFGPQQTFLLVA